MAGFRIDPWTVEGQVNYDKAVKNFGINYIDDALMQRIKKHTGELHYLLSRNIYFAHRDLNWILDEYEKGNKFYVYTGIAPSGSMTLAHLIPFIFAQWLQKKFGAEVYIQIPDEEKYLAKKNISLDTIHRLAYEDALDIICLGFDEKKTKIFFDTEYANVLYKQAVRVAKHITFSSMKDAFGMTNETNIGWIFYTSMQAVPAFLKSVEEGHNVPCLIPLAIDQDVHFRIARDAITKLGYYKPAIVHAKFLPALNGASKMSSSDPLNTIYLNDDADAVNKKIQRAFTGQQATAELQRKFGGDPDKCVVCQYYKYLFEPDDDKLKQILDSERSGNLLAGEHKKDLAGRINAFLENHRAKREEYRGRLENFIVR
ncbi:tryptophan--tRNA ligase [Candidatus Marsarchaeota archaeon]|nr:tryptophan--tRNA ligase [Candidatus Marsarchaeota archaeon]